MWNTFVKRCVMKIFWFSFFSFQWNTKYLLDVTASVNVSSFNRFNMQRWLCLLNVYWLGVWINSFQIQEIFKIDPQLQYQTTIQNIHLWFTYGVPCWWPVFCDLLKEWFHISHISTESCYFFYIFSAHIFARRKI